MRLYVQVSGTFFSLLAAVQLARTVLGWPIRVADLSIPVWASAVAFLITGTFAVWAFRTAKAAA